MKSWKQSEINFLCKNKDCSSKDIAKALGRSVPSILNKRFILGVRMDPDLYKFKKGQRAWNKGKSRFQVLNSKIKWNVQWTASEEQYIRENYMKMSNSEMGYHLCRTKGSVKRHLFILGLKRYEGNGRFEKGLIAWNIGLKVGNRNFRPLRVLKIVNLAKKKRILDTTKPTNGVVLNGKYKYQRKEDRKIVPKLVKSKLYPVTINSKTTIFIKEPGLEAAEEAREKYFKSRELIERGFRG